jgi:hypothetical protein
MQETPQEDLFSDLSFDNTAKQHIRSAATWAMTIVVVAVISYIIVLVQAFTKDPTFVRPSEGFDMKFMMNNDSISSALITVGLGILINFFLFRFASLAKTAVDGLNQRKLISGFNSLKVYFVIMSILMIIVFVCLLLVVVYGATRTA